MIDALPLLLGSDEYQISRSVRLRSSASAYFNRTPASAASNGQRWTYSGWAKRGALGAVASILAADAGGGTSGGLYFDTDNTLKFGTGATLHKTSAAVFRDPSAWYHIVVVADSTQATGANRLLLYVNGVPQTWTSGTDPTLNGIWLIGKQSTLQGIGFAVGSAASTYFDGYLTEINFIDGQSLPAGLSNWAQAFGETDIATGVWKPKKYTGTYGNNGFYLNFSDPSAATAAAIGKDYSGNGNNWTPNNITLSPTTSASYDSMLDVPTPWADGGNGRGNYCTLNRLVASGLSGGATISNGNLRVSGTAAVSNAYARGTMVLSGKFYAEFSFDVVNATATIGVDTVTATAGALNTSNTNVSYRSGGNRRVLGTETAYGASWVANDIIGVAVDTTANTVEFFKNGVSQGVITSSAFFAQGDCVFAMSKDDVGSPNGFANFGQRPFTYTPPSGFRALNTQNLPTPTILKGNQYFDATLYTGNGTGITVTNSGSMQPDFVWAKNRSNVADHALYDALRTAMLSSNTTAAEVAASNVVSYNSNGFTISGGDSRLNANGNTYVGWQWKEGATQGFDIVTYTGTGVANRTVAHNLGVTPAMIIVKARNSSTYSWNSWHRSLSSGFYISLNTTSAQDSSVSIFPAGGVTSTNWNTGGDPIYNNGSGVTYVAYVFAAVAGYSAFGSYTGNGSADGPFVFCGFRPRWIMTKLSSAAGGGWWIYDTARDPYNATNDLLQANLANASATSLPFDILSNGFKIRTSNVGANTNAATYIFAAFAENPFKYSLAR